MRRLPALCLLALALIPIPLRAAQPANVLLIVNDNSKDSRDIGAYYARKRGLPARNVCHIKCPAIEDFPDADYAKYIEKPVKAYLAKTGLNKTVDYLVTTTGIPLKLRYSDLSVDSLLMCMDLGRSLERTKQMMPNPYYGKKEHFSHKKFKIYLCTRLDGYTVKQVGGLIDRAVSAKRERGLFLIDVSPSRRYDSYGQLTTDMKRAHDILVKKGLLSWRDDTYEFVGNRKNVMGYYSWGSNDASFDIKAYKGMRFRPGAIAETAVSSSARTFRHTKGGQSLIADLIESGVTGVKGYVSEPYVAAMASPSILFDRYTSGYNLAESFYMASRFTFWKDVVIGDPLAAPYAKK